MSPNPEFESLVPDQSFSRRDLIVASLGAGLDAGIPRDAVEAMERRLKAADNPNSKASEIIVYDNAPHAFNADYRPSYRKQEAEDGWRRMQDWLKKHGV